MSSSLTNKDRRRLSECLDKYIKAEDINPLVRLDRVKLWADGYSMKEIADREGLSVQTIQQTVTPLVHKVLEWADKGIDKSK
jgi:DNA-binding NarL/FixJ family response regulator